MRLEDFYDDSNVKKKTRHKIINAIIKLLMDNGFESVTMVDVAIACDITQRNLYRYYNNKDLLIIDAMYQCIQEHMLYESPISDATKETKGIDMLYAILQSFTKHQDESLEVLKIIKLIANFDYFLNTLDTNSPAFIKYTNEYAIDFGIDIRKDIRSAISMGLEDGTIHLFSDNISLITEYIYQSTSSLYTRVFVKHNERSNFSFELVNQHINMIIAGMKT